MEIQIAVAKVGKYAARESGDTLEMVERPHGGLSLVLADGQSSGRGAKVISNLVVRKAIALLAEGVRDGAAARAAHDYLRAQYQGKVSATLNIVSVDLMSRTFVISRNSHCPVIVGQADGVRLLDEPSQVIGIYARTKPVIVEIPMLMPTVVLTFTDGLWTAGERFGNRLDILALVADFLQQPQPSARALADVLLGRALELEQDRPGDDVSLLVAAAVEGAPPDGARRLTVSFPVE